MKFYKSFLFKITLLSNVRQTFPCNNKLPQIPVSCGPNNNMTQWIHNVKYLFSEFILLVKRWSAVLKVDCTVWNGLFSSTLSPQSSSAVKEKQGFNLLSVCLSTQWVCVVSQHLPVPALHQILHTIMAMRFCIVLEQNETTLRQFWLIMANSWPHLTLQKCTVILAIDRGTNWHRMVKHMCFLAEEYDVHNFQSTLNVPRNCLSQWHLGTPFSTLSFQLRFKWMHPWLINC
jgi:hypothetical protein